MRLVKTLLTGSVMVAVVAVALPVPAQQGRPAGRVTTLQGEASVERVSLTQPLPLKFGAEVFARDTVRTGDQSLVRILLGGKAVVTVREHSSLTITEGDTTTIEITSGRLALVVAKEKMKANERIDVKTPNAVAGVRGTVLITEVAQVGGQHQSLFALLSGVADILLLDPSGRPASGPPFTLTALQTLGVIGFTPPAGPRPISQSEAQTLANGYKPTLKDPPSGAHQGITDRQVGQATATAASGGAGSDSLKTFVTPVTGSTPKVSGDDLRNGSKHDPAKPIVTPPKPPPQCEECSVVGAGLSARPIPGRPR